MGRMGLMGKINIRRQLPINPIKPIKPIKQKTITKKIK